MMQLPLAIRYTRNRQRETVAWLIHGTDAGTWLAELSRWGVELGQLELRLVPASERDGTPVAALVTIASGTQPTVSCRCQQYGCIAERLFLPANARLDPEALEAEIAELLTGHDEEYVFNPAVGLVRFDEGQTLRIADLLQSPSKSETDWGWAQPGNAMCRRLVSVEPEQPPTVEAILAVGRDDIATEKEVPKHLPTGSTSTGSSAEGDQDQRGGGGMLSRALHGLGKALGYGNSSAEPSSGDNALNRLMRLLRDMPDEGLRYALPLEGPEPRGSSPPSQHLFRQDVDFDLGRLDRGGAGSSWYVSAQQYEDLRHTYRELANREIRLGRHRRAAYIFAHLLNDLSDAAAALRSGEHWREAAILYRDRLRNRQAAAECFEQGSLWAEAIEAYRDLDAFEKVGDLHRKLQQCEEAEAAYREAVRRHLDSYDFIEATRLLERKLDSPDEALEALAAGWPGSPQAAQCLQEAFRILAGGDRHEDAREIIKSINPANLAVPTVCNALNVLTNVAKEYPDAAIRDFSTDKVRVTAAQVLPKSSDAQKQELLQQLRSLTPNDRLLARDCHRYSQSERAQGRTKKNRLSGGGASLELLRKTSLAADKEWTAAARTEGACYFAGYEGDTVFVQRKRWELFAKEDDFVSWRVAPGLAGAPVLLQPQAHVWFHIVGLSEPLATVEIPATYTHPHKTPVGQHPGFTGQTCGIARSPDGILWLLERRRDELLVNAYGSRERLLGSQPIPMPPEARLGGTAAFDRIPFAAGSTHLFLGLGRDVYCVRRGVGLEVVRVPGEIRGIWLPPEESPDCVLVACAEGVYLLRQRRTECEVEVVNESMSRPVCGFTKDMRIVLLTEGQYEIYQRAGGHCELTGAGRLAQHVPMAVLTARHLDQILVCYTNGELALFRLS